LTSCIGELKITDKQAIKLQVKPYVQISPQLEKCCLLLSANESYARAEQDIEVLTGISVSHSTQQRLVHRQAFTEPVVNQMVTQVSLDGGKVRLRTPKGQACIWKDYKAVALQQQVVTAFFRDNDALVKWVNRQPKTMIFSCIGDGHDGIWNLFAQISTDWHRFEILDWYHLVENLYKLEQPLSWLKKVKWLLWHGEVDTAIEVLHKCRHRQAANFIIYLQKHWLRIYNYHRLQQEGISIGSGAVESAIKQISRRVKLSGAQWNAANVPQLLKHRCAYLNGYFSTSLQT
jgi:hypothetical protein